MVLMDLQNKEKRQIPALTRSRGVLQFRRYSVVGVSGAFIDWGIYLFLTRCFSFWGTYYIGANAISFSCAVINNFVWHKLWTFREQGTAFADGKKVTKSEDGFVDTSNGLTLLGATPAHLRSLSGQFVTFVIVSCVGLALNSFILHTISTHASVKIAFGTKADLFAKLIATGIVWFWNFGANKFWTFRKG